MKVIAGNWKMHMDPTETRSFLGSFQLDAIPSDREIVLFPPALSLTTAVAVVDGVDRIAVGVQNVHWEDRGAFTGEVSASMAKAAGASFCLIGHSERRHVFGETDDEAAKKVGAAVAAGLIPTVCVGETLEERRAGRVEEVILRQLDAALTEASAAERFLVAYEPVWAIGTGETATPEDAAAAHGVLRARLAEAIGSRSGAVPLLYGGSVKPGNAAELLAAPDVDGVLVGGASLDPESFAAIAAAG